MDAPDEVPMKLTIAFLTFVYIAFTMSSWAPFLLGLLS